MENLCHYISLDNLEKAHVKSYERKSKSGKLSQVKEHEDKRRQREYNEEIKRDAAEDLYDNFVDNSDSKFNFPISFMPENKIKKMYELYKTKKYKFKGVIEDVDDEKGKKRLKEKIKKLEDQGYKKFNIDNNIDQIAVLMFKEKK